jgi:CheY-like chemotaxis protein/HPt (histidine-containing phosphotransfer) domain-containing protein
MSNAILVADPAAENLTILAAQLNRMGFRAVCVQTNEECMAATFENSIQLALIDLYFPGMTDGSLTNLLRIACDSSLPIIGMTNVGSDLGDSGLNAVLIRPIDEGALKEAIDNALAREPSPAARATPVDMRILMEAACDDRDFAIELIRLFFDTMVESRAWLGSALAARDAGDIARAAHKCCGSSSACGMAELERRLRAIEVLGQEGRLDEVQKATDFMLEELGRCRLFLEKEFDLTIA